MGRLCALVARVPVGTNLGLVMGFWMLLTGQLLGARGAVVPALSASGLPAPAVRRAWGSLAHGAWTSAALLAAWEPQVVAEGAWQPCRHAGSQALAAATTGFWRPCLRSGPTPHYRAEAGKAWPAIPRGVIGRVGEAGGQRLALLRGLVRADAADPSPATHQRRVLEQAVAVPAPADGLVVDAGFGVSLLLQVGATAGIARERKNVTARRAPPPPYAGRGRPPTRGHLVRPLARRHRGRLIAATPPEQVITWEENGRLVRAEQGQALVLPEAPADSPVFDVWAIHDPRYSPPWRLATSRRLPPRALRDLDRDRWPVEQVPLAAKQRLGAARQFVHAPEACQRLPAVALRAGAILSDRAATCPAVPTGFWDRHPPRTPGRLRRLLTSCPFPFAYPFPAQLREKRSVTDQLPKGFWGPRRGQAEPTSPADSPTVAA